MNRAVIQLKQIKFPLVQLKVQNYLENQQETELNYELSVAHSFDRDVSHRDFGVRIMVKLNTSSGIDLEVESHAYFTTDIDITEEFINGHFPRINAPAIAYPFVRTFISNLTLNSGFAPLILPAVNFEKLANEVK